MRRNCYCRRDVAAGREGTVTGTEGWWPCHICRQRAVNRKWVASGPDPSGSLPPARFYLLKLPQPCQMQTPFVGQAVKPEPALHIQTPPHHTFKLLISARRRLREEEEEEFWRQPGQFLRLCLKAPQGNKNKTKTLMHLLKTWTQEGK